MDNKFFKTVRLGGFDKKDVLDYVKQVDCDKKIQKEKDEKKLAEITLSLENVNIEKKKIEEEIISLKSENQKILNEKKKLINETNKIVEEAKMFKDKHDDITRILLDIEKKRKVIIEESKKESESIIMKAKIEAEKNINNAIEVSKKMIAEGEIKYKQTVEATIELANLIDNSRKIFNKISDESIELIKNHNKHQI